LPYTPSTLFVTAFGVDAFPGMTLLDVLNLGGVASTRWAVTQLRHC
jgi:hypothetical protein